MSGELIVAVVSVVMAGFAGPIITAVATTEGQKRKFENEREKKDKREVRGLLDEAVEALDLVEVGSERLQAAYFEHGNTKEPYEALFDQAKEAQRTLTRVKARLAIRLGSKEPIGEACASVLGHADRINGLLSRYLAVGSAIPEPSFTEIQKELRAIGDARDNLVDAAFEIVGASLDA